METKASYVQARRFFDFHTLILNSYIKLIIRNTQFLFCHKLSFPIRQSVLQPDFMTGRNRKNNRCAPKKQRWVRCKSVSSAPAPSIIAGTTVKVYTPNRIEASKFQYRLCRKCSGIGLPAAENSYTRQLGSRESSRMRSPGISNLPPCDAQSM